MITFLLDLHHVSAAAPTSESVLYLSTGKYGTGSGDTPASQQYTTAISAPPEISLSLGDGTLTTGAAPPRTTQITFSRRVAGLDRDSDLDSRFFIGRRAYYRGVGTARDGTVYTLDDPLAVADGKITAFSRTPTIVTITVQSGLDAHQRQLPSRKLLGYRSGLRFANNADEVELTGYTNAPSDCTMMAYVLCGRAWTSGASDTWTIMGNRSLWMFIDKPASSNEYRRRLNIGYEDAGGTTIIQGPEFDAEEGFKWLWAQVDVSGVDVIFGVDTATSTGTDATVLVATAEAWKLGRYRTTTTDTADTAIAAWMLFDALIDTSTMIEYQQGRLTGSESDLEWWFPGDSAAGVLLDFAQPNATSPLNGTITGAVACSVFEGGPGLEGSVLPYVGGYQRNCPLVPVDHPARNTFRMSGNETSAIVQVLDRQSPYAIANYYESVLDFIDAGEPAGAGDVHVCPHIGGLVRPRVVNSEALPTADVTGVSLWDWSLLLGENHNDAIVDFGLALDTFFDNPPWAYELEFTVGNAENINFAQFVFSNEVLEILTRSTPNSPDVNLTINVRLAGGGVLTADFTADMYGTVPIRIEADNDGAGSWLRVLLAGRVVATDEDLTANIISTVGIKSSKLSFDSGTIFDQVQVLPMRLWSEVGTTNADAEAKHRTYLYSNPSPSTTNLEGLWYRYTTSRLQLDDETTNANHGTIDTDAVWSPGIAATDRLSAARIPIDVSGLTPTYRESAYDVGYRAISYYLGGDVESISDSVLASSSIADLVATILAGGNCYVIFSLDNGADIGQVQAITSKPTTTLQLASYDPEQGTLPASFILARYATNPSGDTTFVSTADSDRVAFASSSDQTLTKDIKIGDETHRDIFADDSAPSGRKIDLATGYVRRTPADEQATAWADVWSGLRPIYGGQVKGSGYGSVQPGDEVVLEHPDLPGGSVEVVVVDVVKAGDVDTVRGR